MHPASTFLRKLLLVSTVVLLLPRVGWAQGRDPAAAQALFDDARALMSAKRYDEACPKLAESQRLDPGIGTQFHLADCYEQVGRIASAWVTFLDVASQARANGQNDRESLALTRAARLERRLPRLTISVPPQHRVPGLEIHRDGSVVGEVQWGSSIPVDPGNHELTVTAPGKRPGLYQVWAEEAQTKAFEVPALQADPGAAVSPSSPEQHATAAAAVKAPPAASTGSEPADSGSSHVLELTLVGVGVVGIGVGTTYAILAKSQYEDSKEYCQPDNPNKCNEQGMDLRDAALTKGNVATVAFAVGGAALALGGVVWLLGDDDPATSSQQNFQLGAAPERGGGWLVAAGRF